MVEAPTGSTPEAETDQHNILMFQLLSDFIFEEQDTWRSFFGFFCFLHNTLDYCDLKQSIA